MNLPTIKMLNIPSINLQHLRRHTIAASLARPTTLRKAVHRLGFIQADPIRSPARAQDLILRHRVKNYRAGDLERHYASLGIEEDFLYAYGFMSSAIWEHLHPRLQRNLTKTEKRVLEIVATHQKIHPNKLEAYFGRDRQINAWGGYSKATTQTLHSLHYRGLLRIAGREHGIRLYEPAGPAHVPSDPAERLRQLVLTISTIMGPLPENSLRGVLALLGRGAPSLPGRRIIIKTLLQSGDLQSAMIDDYRYVWPAGPLLKNKPDEAVRFLAPFDPIVWDRRRFEHFFGWPYRFEAYTPLPKRKLGYYAMPMLWRDQAIGWVNISNLKQNFSVTAGYVNGEPKEKDFQNAFEVEVESMRVFLEKQ